MNVRAIITSTLVSLSILTCSASNFQSQFKQDEYVYKTFFKDMKTMGIFMDIGAHDGKWFSNTFFFEKELGWKGICIEPIPHVFNTLKINRDCVCINGCITNFAGTAQFLLTAPSSNHIHGDSKKASCHPLDMLSGLICKMNPQAQKTLAKNKNSCTISVPCYTFNDVIKSHNINHINFLSIDTEGGEIDIIKSIDFNNICIDVITVEANYLDRRKEIFQYMLTKNYVWINKLGPDDLYCRSDFPNLKEITETRKLADIPSAIKTQKIKGAKKR